MKQKDQFRILSVKLKVQPLHPTSLVRKVQSVPFAVRPVEIMRVQSVYGPCSEWNALYYEGSNYCANNFSLCSLKIRSLSNNHCWNLTNIIYSAVNFEGLRHFNRPRITCLVGRAYLCPARDENQSAVTSGDLVLPSHTNNAPLWTNYKSNVDISFYQSMCWKWFPPFWIQ